MVNRQKYLPLTGRKEDEVKVEQTQYWKKKKKRNIQRHWRSITGGGRRWRGSSGNGWEKRRPRPKSELQSQEERETRQLKILKTTIMQCFLVLQTKEQYFSYCLYKTSVRVHRIANRWPYRRNVLCVQWGLSGIIVHSKVSQTVGRDLIHVADSKNYLKTVVSTHSCKVTYCNIHS